MSEYIVIVDPSDCRFKAGEGKQFLQKFLQFVFYIIIHRVVAVFSICCDIPEALPHTITKL